MDEDEIERIALSQIQRRNFGGISIVEYAMDVAREAVGAAVEAEQAKTATMQDLVERSVRLLRKGYGSKAGFAYNAKEYVEAAELALRVATEEQSNG